MGIINTIKDKLKPKSKIGLEPTDDQKRQYRYWVGWIRRARAQQPSKKWDRAEARYRGGEKDEDRPFVNDLRKQHEASMSFLDQQDASFKCTPAEGWMNDPQALKESECDAAFLKRVWVEQKMQKACSRMLNDANTINSGTTLVEFDIKKWLPNLRYMPQRDVLRDPDCGGLLEMEDAEGYEEEVSVETFKAWHPDIDEKVFEAIVKKAGSILKEEERDEVDEADVPMYRTIKVVHIFARNSAAIRKEQSEKADEPQQISESLARQLQLDVPKRYIQFVDGWPALIVDEPIWPLDLDNDEFPLTHLQFNQLNNDHYGFTDYQQMERLDLLGDDIMADLGVASFWAAVTKFLGSDTQIIPPEQRAAFLNSRKAEILDKMLTADGKPKLVPMERGRIDNAQMELLRMVQEQVKEASTLAETLANADAQTFKDVTALGARIADANMHQRVNRRLGGPWGYEQSIAEAAIKILEVAHQYIPKYSEVAVMEAQPVMDEMDMPLLDETGQPMMGEETEVVKTMPWQEARQAIAAGGTLIKLGVDALVGPELAEFWPYGVSPREWKLNVKVIVEPGTTRAVTRQQQAASMKQLYVEIFAPFYQIVMQYNPVMGLKFMRDFLEFIGRLAQVPNIEQKLPDISMIQQMVMTYMRQMMAQQQMGAGQQGGGDFNSAEANYGEEQPVEEPAMA